MLKSESLLVYNVVSLMYMTSSKDVHIVQVESAKPKQENIRDTG